MSTTTTTIIAHRGASKSAPENTMAAFQKSYEQGAYGIETDVQLTKDNVPVLMHDITLERTTNTTGYLNKFTYQELLELDAGSWFGKAFVGERIPSLESLLKWVKEKTLYLHLELKNNKLVYRHMEETVYELLRHYQLLNRTTISSFNSTSLKRLKALSNHMKTAFIISKKRKNAALHARQLGANAVHIKYRLLKNKVIKQCREANLDLCVFTVNKPVHMSKCFKNQCNSIITDYPDIGVELYNQFIINKAF